MPRMGLAPGQSRAGFHAAIGRLVADVKISAKELVRMRDYSLTALAKDQILPQENPDLTSYYQNRTEYNPEDVAKAFDSSASLLKYVHIS